MSDFEITELHRRLANLITIGTIKEVETSKACARIDLGNLITGWLPWLAERAGNDCTWWVPDIGEQVVIVSPSGDLSQGIILSALYQKKHTEQHHQADVHRTAYSDGAIIDYDRQLHKLCVKLPANATIEVVSDGGIHLSGDIKIEGNLAVSGNLTVDESVSANDKISSKADVVAGAISLTKHIHPGPNGPTSTPK